MKQAVQLSSNDVGRENDERLANEYRLGVDSQRNPAVWRSESFSIRIVMLEARRHCSVEHSIFRSARKIAFDERI
jgi:hypothetical protein